MALIDSLIFLLSWKSRRETRQMAPEQLLKVEKFQITFNIEPSAANALFWVVGGEKFAIFYFHSLRKFHFFLVLLQQQFHKINLTPMKNLNMTHCPTSTVQVVRIFGVGLNKCVVHKLRKSVASYLHFIQRKFCPRVNFMRQNLRGKLHLEKYLSTLIETFLHVLGRTCVSS